ncbi:hypothetical protein BDD12DRAFT_842480 [Trichophaea hybrida]|nr:hypothetical protein BDD12DRAFT_842480 [Trichophaea hybrida]
MEAGTPQLRLHTVLVFLMIVSCGWAHMAMVDPPSLRHKANPYTTAVDYDYLSPLSSSGSNYPCKGYQTDLGTPQGQSVANYSPGGSYKIRLEGSATHGGGSCQISLSFDGGKSFQVIKSFIGGCVHSQPGSDQTFDFTIPKGAPRGVALLAWSWFNNQGNREFYMNCAVVTIGSGRRRLMKRDELKVTTTKRAVGSQIFLANLSNGCSTLEGTDVEFPDPGSDVTRSGSSKTAAPKGNCGTVKVSGGAGSVGGGGAGGGAGAGSANCTYWRAQGYFCSRATSLEMVKNLRWVGLFVLGTLGFELWALC